MEQFAELPGFEFESALFGAVAYEAEKGAWLDPVTVELNGRTVSCRLSLAEAKHLATSKVQPALEVVDHLAELDRVARREILKDVSGDASELRSTIDEHFTSYGEEVTNLVAAKLGTPDHDAKLFVEHLELGAVSVANSGSLEDLGPGTFSVTLDYAIIWVDGWSFTDQILAVTFDEHRSFQHVASES